MEERTVKYLLDMEVRASEMPKSIDLMTKLRLEIEKATKKNKNLDKDFNALAKTIKKIVKKTEAGWKRSSKALDQHRKLVDKVNNGYKGLALSVGRIAKSLALGGGFVAGLKVLDKYNKTLIVAYNQTARYGHGVRDLEQRMDSLSHKLGMTRVAVLELATSFKRQLPVGSMKNVEKLIENIAMATGASKEAISSMFGDILPLIERYKISFKDFLKLDYESLTAALKSAGGGDIQGMDPKQVRIISEHLAALKELRDAQKSGDKDRLAAAKEEVKAMSALERHGETAGLAVGRALIEPVKEISKTLLKMEKDFNRIAKNIQDAVGPIIDLFVKWKDAILLVGVALGTLVVIGKIAATVTMLMGLLGGLGSAMAAVSAAGGAMAGIAGGLALAVPIAIALGAALAVVGVAIAVLVPAYVELNKVLERRNELLKQNEQRSQEIITVYKAQAGALAESKNPLEKIESQIRTQQVKIVEQEDKLERGRAGGFFGLDKLGTDAAEDEAREMRAEMMKLQKEREKILQKGGKDIKPKVLVEVLEKEAKKVNFGNNKGEDKGKGEDVLDDMKGGTDEVIHGWEDLQGVTKDEITTLQKLGSTHTSVFSAMIEQAKIYGNVSARDLSKQRDKVLETLDDEVGVMQTLLAISKTEGSVRSALITIRLKDKKLLKDVKRFKLDTLNMEDLEGQLVEKKLQRKNKDVQLSQQIKEAYAAQVRSASTLVSIAEAQVTLADRLAIGLGSSVRMRMKVVSAIQDEIKGMMKQQAVLREEYARNGAPELLSQINELESQILQKQIKQADMQKSLRDGYISAIQAMTTGAGTFTKILLTQTDQAGEMQNILGTLPSLTAGAAGGGLKGGVPAFSVGGHGGGAGILSATQTPEYFKKTPGGAWANSVSEAILGGKGFQTTNDLLYQINENTKGNLTGVGGLGSPHYKGAALNLLPGPKPGYLPPPPSKQYGGKVPGVMGSAVPIMAHAGETVIPARAPGGGQSANYTIPRVSVNVKFDNLKHLERLIAQKIQEQLDGNNPVSRLASIGSGSGGIESNRVGFL